MDFEQVIKARHSAVNFEKDFKMTEEDFEKIFALTKTAPSAYNLQFTDYLVVMDEEKKERIRELHFGQYKIHTASAAIIVMGNNASLISNATAENIALKHVQQKYRMGW